MDWLGPLDTLPRTLRLERMLNPRTSHYSTELIIGLCRNYATFLCGRSSMPLAPRKWLAHMGMMKLIFLFRSGKISGGLSV